MFSIIFHNIGKSVENTFFKSQKSLPKHTLVFTHSEWTFCLNILKQWAV